MKMTVFLADSAQTAEGGKAHALGLGWTVTAIPTPPMALVVFIDADPSELQKQLTFNGVLVDDETGNPVLFPDGQGGDRPFSFGVEAQLGLEQPQGMAIPRHRFAWTVNVGPNLALTPGKTYRWRITGPDGLEASESFHVRP